jgi:hypothetical protein
MPSISKPTFSESSFGFAVTEQMIRRHRWRLAGIPYFPWIDEEGLLGWDVNIPFWGLSYFLQFKRGEEFRYRTQPVCFRFPVYKPSRSQQHNILVDWAVSERLTYYCAPCFTSGSDLMHHSLGTTLLANTKFIPARELPRIGLSDNTQHFVTYTKVNSGAFRSKPIIINGIVSAESSLAAEDAGAGGEIDRERLVRIDREYLRGVRERLFGAAGDQEQLSAQVRAFDRRPFSVLRKLARAVLGVEWVIVPVRA